MQRQELGLCEQIQADSAKIQRAIRDEVELEESYELEEPSYEPEETLYTGLSITLKMVFFSKMPKAKPSLRKIGISS